MAKQVPIIALTPLTGQWVVITKYKNRATKDGRSFIEATEKFVVDDQMDGVFELYKKEKRRKARKARNARNARRAGKWVVK